jgi:ABC-type multidrug transport system fused ATPase/permease subunit
LDKKQREGTGEPLVEAVGLSRTYRLGAALVPAVRDVTLEIRKGEFAALQGPSGSGKTTLLNLLGLLDRPDAGSVAVEGRDGESLSENARSDLRRDRFGFVFQTFNLIPVLTAEENVAYPMVIAGTPADARRRRARELLEAVGLAEKGGVRPDLLSGGQRQRVAIARAILANPRILILDEATSSLDSESEALIQDGLRSLRQGRTTFVIAHRLSTIQSADQILVLEQGEIVERGTHDELLVKGGRYRQLYDKQYRFEKDRFINPGEDFTPEPAVAGIPRPSARPNDAL